MMQSDVNFYIDQLKGLRCNIPKEDGRELRDEFHIILCAYVNVHNEGIGVDIQASAITVKEEKRNDYDGMKYEDIIYNYHYGDCGDDDISISPLQYVRITPEEAESKLKLLPYK